MVGLSGAGGRRHHTAYVCVGSNLGHKTRHCLDGIVQLTENEHTRLVARSHLYRTEPVDYLDQDWFVNAVAKVETVLAPVSLLRELMAIETRLGRNRDPAIRFGPRVIDLDLIFYDRRVIDSEELTVPHPRMQNRRFVLEPICDIDPELLHPVLNMTMRRLLENPEIAGQRLSRLEQDS